MASFSEATVLEVRHWNDTLFSFKTTRDQSLRFRNGHFVMLGLEVEGKPLMRAYSIASPNYAEYLEFLSIKVENGPLTSRLQHIAAGDRILLGQKTVGTLVIDDLRPGKRLFLFATGTGLAPFMSIIQDPDTYERFEKVILIHGVRLVSELAYAEFIREELPRHELLGEMVSRQLIYYPTVTREAFKHTGRMTQAIESGSLFADIGEPPLSAATDRGMICGSPGMLKETAALLDAHGFQVSPALGEQGDYVIERAFAER
ncbi:MAG: ferredoxin--NADP reductase [Burkholderiales bacterium]|nr:ferredoxin--NADP reductase [Burkholderiales bacterium]